MGLILVQAKAQWNVQYEILPVEEYVTNYLLQPGALVSNIQFSGSSENIILGTQLENFGYGLPFSNGVVLSNSWAQYLVDPEYDSGVDISAYTPPYFNGPYTTADGGVYSDLLDVSNLACSLLNAVGESNEPIINSEIFDVTTIEFDVIPTSTTLSFHYVLSGSEFYRSMDCYPNPYGLSYASCEYDDVFAIFVSGPGITGPYSAPGNPDGSVNVATLPGTDPALPIISKSINDSTNVSYFVNYCDSLDENEPCYVYPYTQMITNQLEVACGQTYHIRISIADVFDHIYGWNAVLGTIGGTGNGAGNPQVTFSFQPGAAPVYDAYETCNPVYLTGQRSNASNLAEADTLLLTIAGNALAGMDFSFITDTLIIPAGANSVTLQVDIFNDGITEGTENMTVSCLELHNNAQSCWVYAPLDIHDAPDPLQAEGSSIPLCNASEVILAPEVIGGYGEYQYQWYNDSTGEELLVEDPQPGNAYFVVVSDTCGLLPDTAWFDLFSVSLPQFSFDTDSIPYGCSAMIQLEADVSGGYGELQYDWSPYGSNSPMYTYPTYFGPSTVTLVVTDECENTASDSVVIYSTSGEVLQFNMPSTVYTGCDSTVTVVAQPTGGFAPYSYYWITPFGFDAGTSNEYTVSDSTTITLWVFDMCSQFAMTEIVIVPGPEPLTASLPEVLVGNCTESFSPDPQANGGEGALNFQWYDDGVFFSDQSIPIISGETENSEFVVEISDACGQLISDTLMLQITTVPLEVFLPSDTTIHCAEELNLPADVVGGNGVLTYSWTIDGAVVSTQPVLDIFLAGNSVLHFSASDACGQMDSASTMVEVITLPLLLSDTAYTWCNAGSFEIAVPVSGGNGTIVFDWGNENTTAPYTTLWIESATAVQVIATDECMQSDSAIVALDVHPAVATIIAENQADLFFQFVADSSMCFNCDYQWQVSQSESESESENGSENGSGSVFDYFVSEVGDVEVLLMVENDAGCVDTSHYFIEGIPSIFIPNSFTPDGDGVNDTWGIVARGYDKVRIQLYNRWGELVFETNDPTQQWTGNMQGGNYYVPAGIYIYRIFLSTRKNEQVVRDGTITMMR